MRILYVVHILAGTLGLLSGYVALYAAKGDSVHRRSGMIFVYVMLVMSVAGTMLSLVLAKAVAINVPAALLTSYLVITSLVTVRPVAAVNPTVRAALSVIALSVGITMLVFGVQAVANGGKRDGMPAFPFFMFAGVGILGAMGDFRIARNGAAKGVVRLSRHLWRMSFALFIAALSFFLGQAKVIPKPIRIPGLLALPVLAVLVTMLYWLWRMQKRRMNKVFVAT